ncbi:sigma-70 family RNA polymerase sigma factor [Cellulomonas sp.]|uniref:RNA polymerase sigma factor n=1 Tax=Cellulomonas sp. TaxID=40001 RepID=UPI0033901121
MPRNEPPEDAIDQLERVGPASDEPAADQPGTNDRAADPSDEPDAGGPGGDELNADETGSDELNSDETGSDELNSDETGSDERGTAEGDDDVLPGDGTGDRVPRTGPRDAPWFTALVRAHERDVHRYLVRRAGQDAEDLTADVLTIAWRRRDDVPEGAELPWLYRTAGFVLANHRRKGRPIPVEHLPEIVDEDDPALRAVNDERVRLALGALSPRDRQIVLLNAWEGLTGQALADVLGVGRGGADAALSRARARLATAWAGASD